MKRSWIGLGILAVLLVLCLSVSCFLSRSQDPIARALAQAGEFAGQGDWEKALPLFALAQGQWMRWRKGVACVADHTPMEEIDSLFAQLSRYAAGENREEFVPGCAALVTKIEAMADAHGLSVWGLL